MKTLLTLGSGNSPAPASPGVFAVISNALEQTSRRLGCWDTGRFIDGSQRKDVTPDHSVTPETLAYAFATS